MAEQAIARVGDSVSVHCSAHGTVSGVFDEGTAFLTANGLNVVLVGHTGTASCNHRFHAVSGSSILDVSGIPVVRVSDSVEMIGPVTGSGTVISGSPTSFSL